MLEQITKAEWDAIHPDYKNVWTTERTDWPNWAEVREQYMGKRTLMRGGSLGVEGISFEIIEEAKPQRPRVLIYVSGGIADYTADDGIEVVLFDMDNYRDDPKNTDKVPASFADLAEPFSAPVEAAK